MKLEIGIAGWILNDEILNAKSLTLLEFPGVCASFGVKTVELCSRFFASQEAAYLNDLRAQLSKHRLAVRSIAVDMGNIAGADPDVRRTDLESLKSWFYTASAIGSAAIRINTGHADDAHALERTIDGYRELIEVGRQAKVRLLIENHGGISSTSANLQRILSALPGEWFATCPDTGNFAEGDWQPGLKVMAPRAFSCHVKIFSYSEDGIQKYVDHSGANHDYHLPTALRALKDAGYQGPLCVEQGASKTTEASIRDAIAYLREQLAAV